jgi:colicin import membrane protein
MSLARERLEFAPPRTPGMIRALILAVLAHALLIAVLTAGVAWKRDAALVTAEAELWSAIPQEAAAPAPLENSTAPLEVPPAPPETPPLLPQVPQPPIEPTPKPQPAPEPAPEPPRPDPAIALAKEKAKQLKAKQEQEKLTKEKLTKEKLTKEKLDKEKLDKLAKDKEKARDKEKAAEKAKELAKAKATDQKAKDAKALAESKKLEEIRQQNLKRMAGLAGSSGSGGSGAANSSGNALQSSGPSANYAGRVRALIKRNITYIETIVGNPTTEIEVRTSPDGTIISSRVVKASGTKSWDTAALNAIEKANRLPFDENGRVPPSLIIVLSPQELIGN